MPNYKERNNETWLRELRGNDGANAQIDAFQDLGNYLYVVAYNYLRRRRYDVFILDTFEPDDLAALSQDFVQLTLERMAVENFALLMKYSGSGSFLSWSTKVLTNAIASELRKATWARRTRSGNETVDPLATASRPDRLAEDTELRMLADALQDCIERLPERRRVAFVHCTVQDRPAAEIAGELETSANAVNQLVYHAKRDLRRCLESRGYGPESLDNFS